MQIIQNRKKFFILSLLVIIIGFGFMIANAQAGKGALNWDVEFTGGTSMELNMNGNFHYQGRNRSIQSADSGGSGDK